jgi:HPt (histidine-containing phosphotransfer) domain-containing protein
VPFDADLFDTIRELIPFERLRVHLEELDRQMLALANATPASPGLQGKAHTIISQAGMFGLLRMSDCARELEDACRLGVGTAAALSRCAGTAGDVRRYAMPAAAAGRASV